MTKEMNMDQVTYRISVLHCSVFVLVLRFGMRMGLISWDSSERVHFSTPRPSSNPSFVARSVLPSLSLSHPLQSSSSTLISSTSIHPSIHTTKPSTRLVYVMPHNATMLICPPCPPFLSRYSCNRNRCILLSHFILRSRTLVILQSLRSHILSTPSARTTRQLTSRIHIPIRPVQTSLDDGLVEERGRGEERGIY
jgi:hypothetical protein